MVEKMFERKERELNALKGGSSKAVSVETLAAKSHGMVEVKHGG